MRNKNFENLIDSFFFGYNPVNVRTRLEETPDDEYEVNYTKDGAYCFFEVPGFNKTNLKVEFEDGAVEIEGKRTYKVEGQEKTKTISHRFRIGKEYDSSLLEATIEDGILTLFVPNLKKPEPRKRVSLL